MKILVIAPQPFFSPRGTPFSVYYRTLVTAGMGYDIDLLTYGQGQDVDIPGVRIVRIPDFPFFGKVKIGPSFLKLFLDVFIVLWTLWLLVRNRYDFVHAHEEAVFFCAFLKPIFRFKMVYDMHSSLPQQLENFKFSSSGMLIGIFKKLEDFSLRRADAVITICPDLEEYALSLLKDKSCHFLIENSIFDPVKIKGADSSASYLDDSTYQAALDFLSGKPTAVYAGTLEAYQGIDLLIDAFGQLNKTLPGVGLLIVGGRREQVQEYMDRASSLGLDETVHFTGMVSPEMARALAKQAAVLVSPRSRGTNTPLKVYEQLASGIPLVATNIYSHTQVLNDDVAILVEPDPQSMSAGLMEAFESSARVESVVVAAEALYAQKYSRSVYEQKMKALLESLDLCAG